MSRKVVKRNAFYMYMEERKPGVVSSGHKLTRGMQEMSELVKDDWAMMSPEQKQIYADRAQQYNEKHGKVTTPTSPVNEPSADLKIDTWFSQFKDLKCLDTRCPGEARTATRFNNMTAAQILKHKKEVELETLLALHKPSVLQIFTKPGWENLPIVICHFTTYSKHDDDNDLSCEYLPAEIGLTAFSLKNGVMDNFARIIDIKEIPYGHGHEVINSAEELGLPEPGTVPEFKDYKGLLKKIDRFLEKHCGNKQNEEPYVVFALDSDLNMTLKCLESLYELGGYNLSIDVYSLSLYGHLASTRKTEVMRIINARKKEGRTPEEKADDYSRLLAVAESGVSAMRSARTSLDGSFVYAAAHPLAMFGLLLSESAVDEAIKHIDNYKCYEELCCMYHMKAGDKVYNCALNTSNRYAFSLLEILTISNEVKIIKGRHYPEVDEPMPVEKLRRIQWLKRWGVTKFEENMPDKPVEVPEDPFMVRYSKRERRSRGNDSTTQPGNRSPNRHSFAGPNRKENHDSIVRFYGTKFMYDELEAEATDNGGTVSNSFTGEMPDVYAGLRNASKP